MSTDTLVPLNGHKGTRVEVFNTEKLLWALIHSKGLLHPDVKDLYRKTRSIYEKIILNDNQLRDLHDVEYSLWKLHYKHIDEFRRRIRQNSANAESVKSPGRHDIVNLKNGDDNHVEGFRLFLLEASEFYQDLIVKVRRKYLLPEESLFHENGAISTSPVVTKVHKHQFLCHRFLVCLGDLARYKELNEKPGNQNCNWLTAGTYYSEAAMIWPDGGNPHNQLALLATYVGDEFLALYHCIRSVAVKEPFPDAWDNLILLLEKGRSSHLSSLSCEAQFNFLKPSERTIPESKTLLSDGLSKCNMLKVSESACSAGTDLWSLIVRMISFFYIKPSLDDFPCTFASTMIELEALMELDDKKLKATLECYQNLNSARTGPFRALQVVSMLIFIIENHTKGPEMKETEDSTDMQKPVLVQLALTATFIFMGRLADRCLKGNPPDSCPFLSAVLVFVVWLVDMLDKAETQGADEESRSAISYFFGAFVELLNQFDDHEVEVSSPDSTALWEDYELRGFEPLAHVHEVLDFLSHHEYRNSFESGSRCRVLRIIDAAMKFVNRSNDSPKWILYDKTRRKFCRAEFNKFPDRKEPKDIVSSSDIESLQHISIPQKECEKKILCENNIDPCSRESVTVEEEEVILFKPLTRYNSAPFRISLSTDDQTSPEGLGDQTQPSEDCLRRASSLFIAQNQAHVDQFSFHSDISDFRKNKPLRLQESLPKESAAHPFSDIQFSAGPPSLSAWVFSRGSLSTEKGDGASDSSMRGTGPVEETSVSLTALSISETEDAVTDSGKIPMSVPCSSPPYSAPLPSAPLLPDDAAWFSGDSSSFSECKSSGGIREVNNFLKAPHISSYPNWTVAHGPLNYHPGIQGFVDGFPPLLGMTNSPERFHQYKNDHNLEWSNNTIWPVQFNPSGNLGNLYPNDASRFGVFDRWGSPLASSSVVYLENPPLQPAGFPLVYGAAEQVRERAFHGYQKPSPYVCGAGTDLRAEQPPLLQYLKDKEWWLQRESQVRGPYLGN